MSVQELLLQALEELVDDELKNFQGYCTWEILDGCKPIPKSRLQKASQMETVSRLTEAYGEELAVSLTVEILKKMRKNNLATELKDKYAAAASSSSAQSPPAAAAAAAAPGPSMNAQQGAVIFAPTVTSGTTGSWTVNIHKS